jgi:hypothetical protein
MIYAIVRKPLGGVRVGEKGIEYECDHKHYVTVSLDREQYNRLMGEFDALRPSNLGGVQAFVHRWGRFRSEGGDEFPSNAWEDLFKGIEPTQTRPWKKTYHIPFAEFFKYQDRLRQFLLDRKATLFADGFRFGWRRWPDRPIETVPFCVDTWSLLCAAAGLQATAGEEWGTCVRITRDGTYCGRLFWKSERDSYCSDACMNADKQRRHRERVRQASRKET